MREKSGVHDQPECLFTIGRIRKSTGAMATVLYGVQYCEDYALQ